jgi:hypothetical protein
MSTQRTREFQEWSVPIGYFLEHTAFDDETTRLLAKAFDETWEIVKRADRGLEDEGRTAATRAILAKSIIDLAKQGERDLGRLIDGALEGLGATELLKLRHRGWKAKR